MGLGEAGPGHLRSDFRGRVKLASFALDKGDQYAVFCNLHTI